MENIRNLIRGQIRAERERALFPLLEKDCDAKLLDLGCGDGSFTSEVAKEIRTKLIYGVDIVEENVAKAKFRGIDVYKSDLNTKLPFESESFDVVHANQIIEHLSDTDMFIKEIYRVLKVGGYLVISTPNLASFHNIIFLILGKQPPQTSVSDEVYVGTWLNSVWAPEGCSGLSHRRVFTLGALKGLLEHHGFQVERCTGSGFYPFPTLLARFLCFVDKQHAAYIVAKARKIKTTLAVSNNRRDIKN